MKINFLKHTLEGTLSEVERLATTYKDDVFPYKSLGINDFFNFVKNIPYVKDPKGIELVSRPKYTIDRGGDCDDKTVVCLSYFILNKIPCGYSVVGSGKKFHHIFPYIMMNGEKKDFDATYNYNKIFDSRKWGVRKDYPMSNLITLEGYEDEIGRFSFKRKPKIYPKIHSEIMYGEDELLGRFRRPKMKSIVRTVQRTAKKVAAIPKIPTPGSLINNPITRAAAGAVGARGLVEAAGRKINSLPVVNQANGLINQANKAVDNANAMIKQAYSPVLKQVMNNPALLAIASTALTGNPATLGIIKQAYDMAKGMFGKQPEEMSAEEFSQAISATGESTPLLVAIQQLLADPSDGNFARIYAALTPADQASFSEFYKGINKKKNEALDIAAKQPDVTKEMQIYDKSTQQIEKIQSEVNKSIDNVLKATTPAIEHYKAGELEGESPNTSDLDPLVAKIVLQTQYPTIMLDTNLVRKTLIAYIDESVKRNDHYVTVNPEEQTKFLADSWFAAIYPKVTSTKNSVKVRDQIWIILYLLSQEGASNPDYEKYWKPYIHPEAVKDANKMQQTKSSSFLIPAIAVGAGAVFMLMGKKRK